MRVFLGISPTTDYVRMMHHAYGSRQFVTHWPKGAFIADQQTTTNIFIAQSQKVIKIND